MVFLATFARPARQLSTAVFGQAAKSFHSAPARFAAPLTVPFTYERYPEVKRGNYKKLDDADVSFFKSIMDPSRVETDEHAVSAYNMDWLRKYRGNSKLVLKPKTTEEVSQILKYCNEKREGLHLIGGVSISLAVVPQGGNTGLVGGSVPVFDEIVLSMGLMNKILHLDEVSGILTCEAGCVLEWLDNQLADKGFVMPIDLGAKGSCHIGGNVATNAGGIRYLRYGSLHGNVLGIKAVLADGRVVDTISPCRKDNTGYDLKQLFIGSEGTLGVITALSLLTPQRSKAVNVAFLGCSSYEDVCRILSESKRQLGEILSACEFLDDGSMNAVTTHLKRTNPLSGSYPFYALIETSGSNNDHDMEKLNNFLEHIMGEGYCLDGTLAQDSKQASEIWAIRESIAEALLHDGSVYKYDVSIPISKMYDLVMACRERIPEATRVTGYGHVGDGNLHLNITSPTYDKDIVAKLEPFVYEWTSSHSGSVSAEHGLGFMKAHCIGYSKSNESVEVMQAMKKLFDPKGILNPYKTLPSEFHH